jgi:hypothetical protein
MLPSNPTPTPVDQIQNHILESADFEDFLNELARFSAHQMAGDGDDALCGITLLRDRKAATIGWSSDSAREVDEIQYSLSQGPCLTAAEEEREVHVPDLFEEDRWGPDYANAVASHGLRSVLSLPFHLQGDARAALNFMPRPDDLARDDALFSKTLEITGEFAASIDPLGSGPLAEYSDDELLAASDSVFGMLDDPAAIAGTELLARYDAIGMEISRRESAEASRKNTADSLAARPSEPAN